MGNRTSTKRVPDDPSASTVGSAGKAGYTHGHNAGRASREADGFNEPGPMVPGSRFAGGRSLDRGIGVEPFVRFCCTTFCCTTLQWPFSDSGTSLKHQQNDTFLIFCLFK